MSNRFLLSVVVVLAVVVIGLAVFWKPELSPPTPALNPLPPGGDFSLQSADGKVSLQDYRGRLAILYFGYTYCPDICPTTLNTLTEVIHQLTPAEKDKLAFFFISVDPDRDTPEHLKAYVAFFDSSIIGVTGSASEIAELAKRYGVFYDVQPEAKAGEAYIVDHSAESYLVGTDGRLLARMAHGMPSDQVLALVRQYLNQP